MGKENLEQRFLASSSLLYPNEWLIAGGYPSLDSTEIFVEHGSNGFVSGPTLPIPLNRHCQVKINSSHIFFAGGDPQNGLKILVIANFLFF